LAKVPDRFVAKLVSHRISSFSEPVDRVGGEIPTPFFATGFGDRQIDRGRIANVIILMRPNRDPD